MTPQEIVKNFTNIIEKNNQEYSLEELIYMLKIYYKNIYIK